MVALLNRRKSKPDMPRPVGAFGRYIGLRDPAPILKARISVMKRREPAEERRPGQQAGVQLQVLSTKLVSRAYT